MSDFTPLETAILTAIAEPNPALRTALATAKVVTRENSGHGFFTQMTTAKTAPAPCPDVRQMTGPDAWMVDMGDGMRMGFVLWFTDGYPDYLEGFQRGDGEGRTIDLTLRDLKSLRFTKLVPPVQIDG